MWQFLLLLVISIFLFPNNVLGEDKQHNQNYISRDEVHAKLGCDGVYTNQQKELFLLEFKGKRMKSTTYIRSIDVGRNKIVTTFGNELYVRDKAIFTKIVENGRYQIDCEIGNYCKDGLIDGNMVFHDCEITELKLPEAILPFTPMSDINPTATIINKEKVFDQTIRDTKCIT